MQWIVGCAFLRNLTLVFFLRVVIDFALRLFFGAAVFLLQDSKKLIFAAADLFPIVVGQFAPFFLKSPFSSLNLPRISLMFMEVPLLISTAGKQKKGHAENPGLRAARGLKPASTGRPGFLFFASRGGLRWRSF